MTHKQLARWIAAGVGVATLGWPATTYAADTPGRAHFQTLRPGTTSVINVSIPVNVVFVGYPRAALDVGRIIESLPPAADPVVRDAGFYGIKKPMGLHYGYRYQPQFASKDFEDNFFGYLGRIGRNGPPDRYQLAYNAQEHNVLDIGP
jgi:hypothetical protein